MKKVALTVCILAYPALAHAGVAENIHACVKKANEFVGVVLNELEVSYQGNIAEMSSAKWKNAYCEVKLGDVYNLQVNGNDVIFNGYAGRESYALNKALEEKTEALRNQLKSRIALLEQRMEQVSMSLKKPNPNHGQLTRYIDEGIEQSLGVRRKTPESAASAVQDAPRTTDARTEMRPIPAAPVPMQNPSLKPAAQAEVRQRAKVEIESASEKSEMLIPRSTAGDNGKYYLLEARRTGPIVQTLHKRVEVDSVSYTKTEINCQTMQMRVIGFSKESPSSIREHPDRWSDWIHGSSKSDLANFVCR